MSATKPSSMPWVVIPTFNEAPNIAQAISRIVQAVPAAKILVIDDSSPDGTADVVKSIATLEDRVELLLRPKKSGLGSAYRAGFTEGIHRGATALVEMDADLSHEPEAIIELLGALDAGADLAIGSRYVPGGTSPGLTPSRLALSKGGNTYARLVLGLGVKDATSGFRAFRPSLLNAIELESVSADGYGFQIEMVFRAALRKAVITEVPIVFNQRTEGVSKMSSDIVKEAMALCTIWGFQHRLRQLAGKSSDFVPFHKSDGNPLGAIREAYRA